MFLLVVLILVGVCSGEDRYDYHADQHNVTLTSLIGNGYIRLTDVENGYPTGIEYLRNIDAGTGLMVRMFFDNDDDSLDPANDTRMNICDVLDKAIDDLNSPSSQYQIAEALGLTASRCPILPGIKVLSPYEFPTDFTSNDIGSGPRYYRVRVETANQGLDTQAIMELRVDLTLTMNNTTYPENSGSKLLMPSIMSSFTIGLMVFQLNN